MLRRLLMVVAFLNFIVALMYVSLVVYEGWSNWWLLIAMVWAGVAGGYVWIADECRKSDL